MNEPKHDAAAVRRLRLNLEHAKQLDTFNEQLLMKCEQVLSRLDGSTREIKIHNVLNAKGEPKLDVTWEGTLIQIDVEKARELAWMFSEAASTAQAEADLCRFMVERVGLARDRLGAMLYDLRQFRKDDPQPPAKGTPIPDAPAPSTVEAPEMPE